MTGAGPATLPAIQPRVGVRGLNLTPADVQTSRHLRLLNPALSRTELAQRIPVTDRHKQLVIWMRDDLGQYLDHHGDIWERRRQSRNYLIGCNRDLVRQALDKFADAVQSLNDLTMADFHSLVSVFVSPDHNPNSILRAQMDITGQSGGQKWQTLWPSEALLFTNAKLGFGRMARSYGMQSHYLGLISHLDMETSPHGHVMLPWEFLEHDLLHAQAISNNLYSVDDWPSIHQAFDLLQSNSTDPERQIDDLVYFFLTPELYGYVTSEVLYRIIAGRDEMLPWLEKIVADQWPSMLQKSIERVTKFWMDHVPSASLSHEQRDLMKR